MFANLFHQVHHQRYSSDLSKPIEDIGASSIKNRVDTFPAILTGASLIGLIEKLLNTSNVPPLPSERIYVI